MNDELNDLMDLKSACKYLAIKQSHLRALVFKRKIPVTRIGRLLRFRKEQLDNWLDSQQTNFQQ